MIVLLGSYLLFALVVLDSPSLGADTRADTQEYVQEYEQLLERTEDKDSLDAIRQLHEQGPLV